MSSYAQVADLVKYSPSLDALSTPQLQTLLDSAETDLDRLALPPTILTASRQLISASGTVTGGAFHLALDWVSGRTYTTAAIAYNVNVLTIILALNLATDNYGFALPSVTSWQSPQTTSNEIQYPAGPLPSIPVAVEASGDFAEQALPLLQVVNSTLTGGGTYVITSITEGGKKIDPTGLMPRQIQALSNATCAQAEFRNVMGENFFIRPQYDSVSGPVFSTSGKLPLIAPKAKRELAGSGLLLIGARASWGRSRRPRPSNLGWPAYRAPEGGDYW